MEGANLTNHFLIAMPGLHDPNFSQTVTYICEHRDEGAMGIVINRPTGLHLGDVLAHMNINEPVNAVAGQPVFIGGPLEEERGFVLHEFTTYWDSTLKISEAIAVTTSRDILEAISKGEGPEKFLVALGYAGWDKGQLEQELADNAWLSCPAKNTILFDTLTQDKWQAAAKSMGVDVNLISQTTGHG